MYEKKSAVFLYAISPVHMGAGLMQVLAFMHQKGGVHEKVATDLRTWLVKHITSTDGDPGFEKFMEALMRAKPADYQSINAEAFAWLKWLRQMAAARVKWE